MNFPAPLKFFASEQTWLELLPMFPMVLWISAIFFFALGLLPPFRKLITSSVLIGLLGSALGYLHLHLLRAEHSIKLAELFPDGLLSQTEDYSAAALVFFTIAWSFAGLGILARRGQWFANRGQQVANGLALLLLLVATAYLGLSVHHQAQVAFEESGDLIYPGAPRLKTR